MTNREIIEEIKEKINLWKKYKLNLRWGVYVQFLHLVHIGSYYWNLIKIKDGELILANKKIFHKRKVKYLNKKQLFNILDILERTIASELGSSEFTSSVINLSNFKIKRIK